jgi:CelD/BcsL family acetyltransferase involved in cellulose biosynthesis
MHLAEQQMAREAKRTANLTVSCLREDLALQQLESEWNELLSESSSKTIFMTWEWIWTWWRVYGHEGDLYVITVRDEDSRLLGIAPFKLAKRRLVGIVRTSVLEFIGSGDDVFPAYLDLIIRKGREKEIVPAIIERILADAVVKGVDLSPYSANSPNLVILMDLLGSCSGHLSASIRSVCPIATLPDSWAEFLASKSKNFRKKMGEYERRCKRDLDLDFRRSMDVNNLTDDMSMMTDLHHMRWNGRSMSFRSEKYLKFHTELARKLRQRDWLRLHFMEDGSKPIAALYCFKYQNKFYYYQSGRDPSYSRYRVGLVLMNEVIREAIEEGAESFDFLSGAESYKYRWANTELKNLRVAWWRSSTKRLLGRLAGLDGYLRRGILNSFRKRFPG